jgi:hypothetical protein
MGHALTPSVCLGSSEVGPVISVSNKLPGDADAAGPQTTLGGAAFQTQVCPSLPGSVVLAVVQAQP